MTNEEKAAKGLALTAQKILANNKRVQRSTMSLARIEEVRRSAVADLAYAVQEAIIFGALDVPEDVDIPEEPIVETIERLALELVGMGAADIAAMFGGRIDA